MSSVRPTRLCLVAVDGFSPAQLDEYAADGGLPTFRWLRRAGSTLPLVSTMPATTPVAWATVATGAQPSAHGIEGFLLQPEDRALGDRVSGCFSHRCRVEPIWTSAALEGRRTVVIKFPLSYPSRTATLRIDGASGWGGLKCLHELVSAAVWSARPTAGEVPLVVVSESPSDGWRSRVELRCLWRDEVVAIDVLVRGASVELGTVEGRALATLSPGNWSEPLTLDAPGRGGVSTGAFRIKVLEASERERKLRVYSTPLHELRGHSYPEHLWDAVQARVGPIEEQTEPTLFLSGLVDLETQLELFALNVDWLARAAAAAIELVDPHLLMVHVHILDWAHHMLQASVDSAHEGYDAGTASVHRSALRRCYEMVDDLVRRVSAAMPAASDIVVLGDHGQDLHHTTVHLNEWLANKGWLHWLEDGRPNLAETKVLAMGNYIYINEIGRRPGGIVHPQEVPELRAQLVSELERLRDERTGCGVVARVGPKADWRDAGGDGAGAGDVIVCFRRGYQASNGRGALFEPTHALKQFTSGHDHFLPTEEALLTRMYAAGPRFARGRHDESPRPLVDVMPTLAAALGITPPPSCSGQPIRSVLVSS